MSARSPTTSVKSREVIGVDQFSQRREVFDKHDTVFMPLPSPTSMVPVAEVEPVVTSNHGKTTSNFKRNTTGYSSMRESRTDERNQFDFRTRKYSDNFTSEMNQSDDVDYRYSMTERTRRLSKLRREFLNSNLHEPSNDNPFARVGTRASLPARSPPIRYKIESPNLYKFPFAEPYATPPPVRRVVVDLGPIENIDVYKKGNEKENQDPETKPKHQSLPNNDNTSKIDHQKLFEELVKRYSPQRKPVDWTLPPTRPRIVSSVPKLTSSVSEKIDENRNSEEKLNKPEDDDVFLKKKGDTNEDSNQKVEEPNHHVALLQNGVDTVSDQELKNDCVKNETDSKVSETELEEKNDDVPDLSIIQRQLSRESAKRPPLDQVVDLSIPALIEKMTVEGEDLENHKKEAKKVKRKRSFLDKILGRNKTK